MSAKAQAKTCFWSKTVCYIRQTWQAVHLMVLLAVLSFSSRLISIKVVERRITRDEFYLADEIFMTGTAAEVTPIREYDDRTIGNGGRGPLTEKLQSLYFDVVHGRNEQYMDWLALLTNKVVSLKTKKAEHNCSVFFYANIAIIFILKIKVRKSPCLKDSSTADNNDDIKQIICIKWGTNTGLITPINCMAWYLAILRHRFVSSVLPMIPPMYVQKSNVKNCHH